MSEATEVVSVLASVARVATLADQGLRITFDLPDDAIYAAAWLMACRQSSVAIRLDMRQETKDAVGNGRETKDAG
jgi:hypothetical protein